MVGPLPEGAAPGPELGWAAAAGRAGLARFALPQRYVLLAPGASPNRPRKRWPAEGFAALARNLEGLGFTPMVVGGAAEAAIGRVIAQAAPSTIVTAGGTTLFEVAALGAGAALVIGNDTGPAYLAAFAGAPALVLFSADSDPALCAPRKAGFHVLRKSDLNALAAAEVTNAAQLLLGCA